MMEKEKSFLKLEEPMVFVNYSNHPSDRWDEIQLNAAKEYGEIVDVAFPNVDSSCTKEEIAKLAEKEVDRILSFNPSCVLCQGEFTLVFQIVNQLKEKGVKVVAACTERIAKEEDGVRTSIFKFVQYREY